MTKSWFNSYPKNMPHEADTSKYKSIADALRQATKRFGDSPAVSCLGATLSFNDLDTLSDHFASYLQNTVGMKKGDRLAIMLPNVLQFPIVFLGAQKAGIVCVNTNPQYTPREMLHQFNDSGVTAIVIMDMFLDKLEKILPETKIKTVVSTKVGDQFPIIKNLLVTAVLKYKKKIPPHNLKTVCFRSAIALGAGKKFSAPEINSGDLALLQYTGGTTGVSKGAMLSQGNIIANMVQIRTWAAENLVDGKETVLTALPLYHIFALTVNFLAFIASGMHMVLVPDPRDLSKLVGLFRKYNFTVLTGVNTLFNGLNNNKEFKALAPKSLKFAMAGGMALQESVSLAWQKITGILIKEGFGLTEASPVTHCNPLGVTTPLNSIGLPVPSTDVKLVDENGNEVKPGEPGELCIKGPQVMMGYWNRPDETAKTLKDGWLWTGDIARMDDNGYFFIVDRKKDMILVSGFNVFPNEVEAVIAAHPKVLEVAVIGVPDKTSGEAVKAYIVPKDRSLTREEINHYCREQLTGYKRPRQIEFRESLPKTNIGKILRRTLKEEDAAAQGTVKTT